MNPPKAIDLKKDRGLTIDWGDGVTSYYTIAYLRRMSPSAEARETRRQMEQNPLTVLPSSPRSGGLTALGAELVGNYALRIRFSDGHDTGIFSWTYLREIDPAVLEARKAKMEPGDPRGERGESGEGSGGGGA